MLKNKFIVVGVTGSIAAYKSVELVRLFKRAKANVQVIMTKSACEFIRPLTFQVVSQNPVITDMFEPPSFWEVKHISLADKADIFAVAPATANIIAKLAAGIADDMLTSTILATKAKVIIVPAMNVNMFNNNITQRNIKVLRDNGIYVLEPDEGDLACGYKGKGRFPEPRSILEQIEIILGKDGKLKGKRILITAGPTREPIDPVRFITNHSSGKMGYALAEKAIKRGAQVTLISGPTNLDPPLGLSKFISVETAQQMYRAVMENYTDMDVIIKSAAVADFSPKNHSNEKLKKRDFKRCIELKQNPDILKILGESKKNNQILIGFAAETNDIESNAIEKVRSKNLDLIIANDVTKDGAGFAEDTNIVKIIHKNGHIEELPKMLKRDLADEILDRVQMLLQQKSLA